MDENSLQGWKPQAGEGHSLEAILERAFDYRGNVTLTFTDGSRRVGYVCNRNTDLAEPFLELIDEDGRGPLVFPYRLVAGVEFTGADTASGRSFEDWKRRRQAGQDRPGAGEDDDHEF